MEKSIKIGFPDLSSARFPNIVNVEVFRGECPCRCRHCPVGQVEPESRALRFGKGKMSIELFQRIVSEMSQFPHSILRLHSVGEPLLWNDLIPALKLSRRYGVRTWVFTSALTRKRDTLKALAENCDILEISVNDINVTDYLAAKGVDGFDLVSGNIHCMLRHIRDENTGTRLIVSRVQGDRQGDEEFTAYWKSIAHDAFVRSFHTYNNMIDNLAEHPPGVLNHEPCLVHWARFNINFQGKAVICFNELFRSILDPKLILGDIRTHSIKEIWQGNNLNSIRNAELTGDYSRLSFSGSLPCPTCQFCQPLQGEGQTSEYQVEKISC